MEIKPTNQASFTFSEANWAAIESQTLPRELKERFKQARREFSKPYLPQGHFDETNSTPDEDERFERGYRDTEILFLPEEHYTNGKGEEQPVIHVQLDNDELLLLLEAAKVERESSQDIINNFEQYAADRTTPQDKQDAIKPEENEIWREFTKQQLEIDLQLNLKRIPITSGIIAAITKALNK
jgi:hypothetical protein